MSSWSKSCTHSFCPCAHMMIRPRHEFAHIMIRFPNGIYQTSNYWNVPCRTYMPMNLIELWHYAAVNHIQNMVELFSITNFGEILGRKYRKNFKSRKKCRNDTRILTRVTNQVSTLHGTNILYFEFQNGILLMAYCYRNDDKTAEQI